MAPASEQIAWKTRAKGCEKPSWKWVHVARYFTPEEKVSFADFAVKLRGSRLRPIWWRASPFPWRRVRALPRRNPHGVTSY